MEQNSIFSLITKSLGLLGGKITKSLSGAGLAIAKSTDSSFLDRVSRLQGVSSVVPDFEIQWLDPPGEEDGETNRLLAASNPPNSKEDDKLFNLQWGLDAINAPEAWDAGYRGKGCVVAVIDAGFDLNHPDIKANILSSTSFVDGETAQYTGSGVESHGTHVAGIIAAADNGAGIIGVAPEAKLMLVKVISDATGAGTFSAIIDAINYAVDNGANVINLSLGGGVPIFNTQIINAFNAVTNYAYRKGVTVIAAAGNDGSNRDSAIRTSYMMPAEASNVIAISATGPNGWAKRPTTTNLDTFATYSNYGVKTIDFAAPGGGISYAADDKITLAGVTSYVGDFDFVYSTGGNGGYWWCAGTSMAAPHATGVVALLIGKNKGKMTPNQVLQTLKASADDLGTRGQDKYYGYGRINALKAVKVTTKFSP